MCTSQQQEFEHQQQPQRKTIKTKPGKIASKPSRLLFEENTSTEGAAQRASELLPSPSQIDPEFLAALPDDVRQEIEQAYKRKDACGTRARVQAPPSGAPHVPVFPPERSTEKSTGAVQSDEVQRKACPEVTTPPKQVNNTVTILSYTENLGWLHIRCKSLSKKKTLSRDRKRES